MPRLGCLLMIAGIALPATLEVTIVDKTQGGQPCPARVYLTTAKGQLLFPDNVLVYDRERFGFAERHFVPSRGRFQIELPEGTYGIEVEKGKEYIPVRRGVRVRGPGRLAVQIELDRWIDATSLGWYSADLHLHRPLRDIPLLMEAEDLNVTAPISRWRYGKESIREDPDLPSLLKKNPSGVYAVSPRRLFTLVNEELEPPEAALLSFSWGSRGSELAYPLARYGRQARRQGIIVDSEKATNLELPVVVALEGCDTIGVANNHFWRSGWYPGPWGAWPGATPTRRPESCLGYALAGFDIYYALLNAGFRVTLSAGSASGVHPVPPGWSRVYVHLDGELEAANWFQALRAGRSFVTTGPLLFLRVNGQLPGSTLRVPTLPATVDVDIELWSLYPVDRLELVVNGHAQQLPLQADSSRSRRYSLRTRVELQESSWIAARWLASRDASCDLAHTSPVFVICGDRPLPMRRDAIHYLLERVHALRQRLENPTPDDRWAAVVAGETPAEKQAALDALAETERIYLQRLLEAQ